MEHNPRIVLKISILLEVERNGDCLFESFMKQMIFKEEEGDKKYQACYLKRQVIVHFIYHCGEKEYKDWVIK